MSSRNIHLGREFPLSLENAHIVKTLKHEHILPGEGIFITFKFHHFGIIKLECIDGNLSFLQIPKPVLETTHTLR